jgi:hypothetical protein
MFDCKEENITRRLEVFAPWKKTSWPPSIHGNYILHPVANQIEYDLKHYGLKLFKLSILIFLTFCFMFTCHFE